MSLCNTDRYGHWKAKGLTIRKHTLGLDSGAVYGQALSALVVSPRDLYEAERKSSKLRIRNVRVEGRRAIVVSLPCNTPKAKKRSKA